jgi:diguanylate cyclase (GGDEF)-like protein
VSSLPPSIRPPALAELLAAAPLFSKLPPRVRGEVADRRWFDTMFPRQVARLQQEGPAGGLLMVDVDRFKALNDAYGHGVGDVVLTHIGAALTAGLRPGDLLARVGGEEFAALLGDIDEPAARDVAERLRQLAAAREDTPPCTVSIGVAGIRAGETFEALVRRGTWT